MKTKFINELGNEIGVSVKRRNDGFVVWAIWSKASCQSGVVTEQEALTLGEYLIQESRKGIEPLCSK